MGWFSAHETGSELDAVVVFDGELLGLAALEVAGEFLAAVEGLVVAVVGVL